MDYKEKYEMALEGIQEILGSGADSIKMSRLQLRLQGIFPELKESEDERIRKAIIECVKNYGPSSANPQLFKNMIAWLKKHGQETSWKPSKEEMDVLYGLSYITNEFDKRKEEVITRLYQDLKREFFNGASFENMFPTNTSVELEKQGEQKSISITDEWIEDYWQHEKVNNPYSYDKGDEIQFDHQGFVRFCKKYCQKPTDEVNTRFKVGDWITNSIETVQITGYDIDYGYQVDYKGNLQHRDTDIIEKEYHLWTIQDAKDGDVLCGYPTDDYPWIGIFHELNDDDTFKSYCYLQAGITGKFCPPSGVNIFNRRNVDGHNSKIVAPAHKEQRDMFFQKMHEAGYEWDFEVKELNKIEKKPAWSEEDEENLKGIIWEIKANKCSAPPYDIANYDRFLSWLKLIKDRVQL